MIKVMATGRLLTTPNPITTENGDAVVFVIDPFPGPTPAGTAHQCEVLYHHPRLAHALLDHGIIGASVILRGELTLWHPSAPVEDELSAVRVSINADDIHLGITHSPTSE
jgi:hypothetical protein